MCRCQCKLTGQWRSQLPVEYRFNPRCYCGQHAGNLHRHGHQQRACTATASILVAHPPTIGAAGSNSPVCIGSAIQLNSAPSGGTMPYGNFAWAGPNNYSANVEDPTTFPAVAAAAGTYAVVLTDAAGCTATASTTITVSGNSAPAISAGSNSPVCAGANILLNSTPSGGTGAGYTYLWSGPNNFGAVVQNPAPFAAVAAAGGTYSVTLTDNAGCTGTGSTMVQINARPNVVAGNNGPVSVGATVFLNAVASGGSGVGYTYVWSGPNNYAATGAQPAGFAGSLATAGVYTVTVTDGSGCTGTGHDHGSGSLLSNYYCRCEWGSLRRQYGESAIDPN